ncbi:MAG TPA: hypothetical protein VKE42_07160 [Candidatus Cybelea sp.]|nr:hypothetical protein [Candidatus Cybelea sp.]
MTRALAIFIVVAAGTVRGAVADPGCTQETLSVQGTPVSIGYCVSAAPRANGASELIVPVWATYSAPGGTLRRTSELHFISGERVSRVLESLDLTRVGLTGTLHLTLAYSRGAVRVEGALLTPGAITIK